MRLGIIGAGQLGRMLALAGYPLGIQSTFLDPDDASPGGQVGPVLLGAIDDARRIRALAERVDVVTVDIENVPVAALEEARALADVRPPSAALAVAQDRLSEKELFEAMGIPTAPYLPVASRADLQNVGDTVGWPVVLKARRLGYDGRGQRTANSAAELETAWREIGSVPAIAEGRVNFESELSLLAARGGGETAFYPLAENVHDDGILLSTTAPYDDAALQRRAESYLGAVLEHFDYCGVMAVEFFLADGRLIANELAPRVHNSGHWTIEGAETSQFENHLRAIFGLPLGRTKPTGHTLMVNLLGDMPKLEGLLRVEGLHLHTYGKTPRPRRKIGHCTLVAGSRSALLERAVAMRAAIAPP